MKHLIQTIVLTLALCLSLSACGGKENTPTESTTSTDTSLNTLIAETTPSAPEPKVIFANGKTDYKIVRSGTVNGVEQQLFLQFYLQMDARSGCKFQYIEDTIAFGKTPDPTAPEILLGNTNREESALLLEKLNELGGNRFGILVGEHKIAIAGTDSYQTYLGLDYLMTNYIQTAENGQPIMHLEQGFTYFSENSDSSARFDVDQLKESGRGLVFAMTERVIHVPTIDGCNVMQGGGTDGKYAYFGLINKSTSPETAVISKYDLDTMELVMTSRVIPTGHTNDITYDSKNHRLVISSGLNDWRGTISLNPDTLEIIDHQIAPIGNRGIEYLPSTDQYLVASGYTIYITDANLNPISSFQCQNPQYVTQGLTGDEKYVYDVRYNNAGGSHYVIIHDMQGNYIGSARLAGITHEPENMFIRNGEYYLGCNQSNSVYHMELIPENWW